MKIRYVLRWVWIFAPKIAMNVIESKCICNHFSCNTPVQILELLSKDLFCGKKFARALHSYAIFAFGLQWPWNIFKVFPGKLALFRFVFACIKLLSLSKIASKKVGRAGQLAGALKSELQFHISNIPRNGIYLRNVLNNRLRAIFF